jgi:hypothetical protein
LLCFEPGSTGSERAGSSPAAQRYFDSEKVNCGALYCYKFAGVVIFEDSKLGVFQDESTAADIRSERLQPTRLGTIKDISFVVVLAYQLFIAFN